MLRINKENIMKYTFFYGGTFSQWFRSDFIIDNITYNCAEQYMMAQKALMFEDSFAYHKIMTTVNPFTQKKIGRKVINFVPEFTC